MMYTMVNPWFYRKCFAHCIRCHPGFYRHRFVNHCHYRNHYASSHGHRRNHYASSHCLSRQGHSSTLTTIAMRGRHFRSQGHSSRQGPSDSSAGNCVLLKSSEGEIFEVETQVARMSGLIKSIVDDTTDSGTDEEIPLANVNSAVLSKIIEYCQYHKDDPPQEIVKPLPSTNLLECGVCAWDTKYIDDIEREVLVALITATNYLDIEPLFDLCRAKFATIIKGKSPEEIRELFDYPTDEV